MSVTYEIVTNDAVETDGDVVEVWINDGLVAEIYRRTDGVIVIQSYKLDVALEYSIFVNALEGGRSRVV